jgi:glucuronate isomerase
MFRRALAETLAGDAVRGRGWSIDRALEVARHVLLDNPRRIFRRVESASPRPAST